MEAGLIKKIFVNWKRNSRMEITLPKRSCIETLSVGYCLTSSK